MRYSVMLTSYAVRQVQNTIEYISNELLSPKTAELLLNYPEKAVAGLDIMPERHTRVEREP